MTVPEFRVDVIQAPFIGGTGPTGPAGPAGATGPQGPAGADGTGGGGSGGSLLSGTSAPASGSGLDPLDGVSDPWRWSAVYGVWVGPAYNVTWLTGDTIPSLTALPSGAEELDLVIGPPTRPNSIAIYSEIINGTTGSDGPIVATSDGSGVAYLLQYETGFTGPTTVPDATVDITTLLGDFTAGAAYSWNETGDGADGDFWLNKTTMDLYGPKAAGAWPTPPKNIEGFDSAASHILTSEWYFIPGYAGAATVVVGGGTEPDTSELSDGQVAVWYDPTAAAPVMNFKAKDAAGTVYVATLPMTPA